MFWSRQLSQEVQLRLTFNRTTHGAQTICSVDVFRKMLAVKLGNTLEESLYRVLADGQHELTCEQFVSAVGRYSRLTGDEAVDFVFTLYDRDGRGKLDRAAVQQLLETACDVHEVETSQAQVDHLTSLLMDGHEFIDSERLQKLVAEHQHLKLHISVFDWFVGGTKPPKPNEAQNEHRLLQSGYYRHNLKTMLLVIVFCAVVIALAVERYMSESALHVAVQLNESTAQSIGACHITNHLSGLHSRWELWAKIFGKVLNFVPIVALVLVLRNLITYLRKLGCNQYLPLDHHIFFHKLVGYLIAACSFIHTACHVGNVVTLADSPSDIVCLLFTPAGFLGSGSIKAAPFITGWLLLAVLALLIGFSIPAVRRSGHFQLFFNVHRLYYVFFVLLVLHGPKFWQWLVLPGALYVGEVFVRLTGLLRKFGRTYVTKAELFSGDAVGLTIARPAGFKYRCGDYVYLNVPSISAYEWHPFTVSSAPEVDDLTLHIRVVGEWTRHLQQMFMATYAQKEKEHQKQQRMRYQLHLRGQQQQQQMATKPPPHRRHTILFTDRSASSTRSINSGRPQDSRVAVEIDSARESVAFVSIKRRTPEPTYRRISRRISRLASTNPLVERYKPTVERATPSVESHQTDDIVVEQKVTVNIDGPYGAPSSDFMHSTHPVLVAAGIGVTPFVSITQSIIHRYLQMKTQCPHCNNDIIAGPPPSLAQLRRVDFIWIVRDFKWVTWFRAAFDDLVKNQGEYSSVLKDLIRIKIYVTSPKERVSASNLLLGLALNRANTYDVTRKTLRSNVELGRPNWSKILEAIKADNKDATVFFCGPPALAKDIRHTCICYKLDFRKETF